MGKGRAHLLPIQLDISMNNQPPRLINAMRKTTPKNKHIHPSLNLTQHQAPDRRKTLLIILSPPLPFHPRIPHRTPMFIQKDLIIGPNAGTSERSREFARTHIRDGTREIPFLE